MTQTIDQNFPPQHRQAPTPPPTIIDNVSGPVILVIEPSVKVFKSADCGTWTKR